MTKEQLEQVIDLRNEISQFEKELARFKNSENQGKTAEALSEHPYSGASADRKERKAMQKILELNERLLEIEEWATSLDNSKMRQIILYKYFAGLTWREVAAKMGHQYSADGCRKACKRFLEKI